MSFFANTSLRTLAISETQKYGHVTYFWNGNKSGYINESLEDYIEIPSLNIPFDEQPKMRAEEITERVISALSSDDQSPQYDFIRINYPNGDMIGHTGNMDAAIQSVETVDSCVKRLAAAVEKAQGILVVLSDHGNAEDMRIPSHTLNPVPFVILDFDGQNQYRFEEVADPGLANTAATLCHLLGFEAPVDYAPSLIRAL